MTDEANGETPAPTTDEGPPARRSLRQRSRDRRNAKWDHRPNRRSWRWSVSVTGRILIATGMLLFGFIAYQLWGTGFETARAQRGLAEEFDLILAGTTTTAPPTDTTTAPPTDTTITPTTSPTTDPDGEAPPEPDPEPEPEPEPEPPGIDQPFGPIEIGDPLARLEIPALDRDDIIVAGVGVGELQRGPGHFPDTPIPGQLGNAAIAGHRTTYGQPFRNVDRLEPGDEIIVTTIAGRFVYRVTGTIIVSPQDYQVVATTRDDVAELTLVSCHPVFSAAQRIIVSAELDEDLSDAVGRPIRYGIADATPELPSEDTPDTTATPPSGSDTTGPDTTGPDTTGPDTTEPSTTDPDTTGPDTTGPDTSTVPGVDDDDGETGGTSSIEDAFGRGWFHDRDAFPQIALWGALLALVSILSYVLSRIARRDLVGFVVGVAPFAIAAFFFFQNVNRLLPPNL